jgi:hypothetical protein
VGWRAFFAVSISCHANETVLRGWFRSDAELIQGVTGDPDFDSILYCSVDSLPQKRANAAKSLYCVIQEAFASDNCLNRLVTIIGMYLTAYE